MSTRADGCASRSRMSGIRLWPPARTLASSPNLTSSSDASCTEEARAYSNAAGITGRNPPGGVDLPAVSPRTPVRRRRRCPRSGPLRGFPAPAPSAPLGAGRRRRPVGRVRRGSSVVILLVARPFLRRALRPGLGLAAGLADLTLVQAARQLGLGAALARRVVNLGFVRDGHRV